MIDYKSDDKQAYLARLISLLLMPFEDFFVQLIIYAPSAMHLRTFQIFPILFGRPPRLVNIIVIEKTIYFFKILLISETVYNSGDDRLHARHE